MKRFSLMIITASLCVGMLASCQSTPPITDTESESSLPTVPSTTAPLEETVTLPPADQPEGEPPMEKISCFQNPILTAETENAWPEYGFGDPFVMRHNGIYYLYVSTKDGSVGIKCWSSHDLVNWTFEGFCSNHPVTRGAYAPEVYYYNGYFYMYMSPAGNGHYVLRSTSPTKGFEPVTDNMGMSIDGSVFIDHDGKWYFYSAGHGAIQAYDMASPTEMKAGRTLHSVSVNGGWTEGSMTVYHDGYYYITYTGNHVLSPSYRILYGVSDESPVDFTTPIGQNPLLISTSDAVFGIGHSSTVKGPDLDSYYIVYHSLVNTTPNRNMNIDRIWFNGERMEILGPTTDSQQIPELPDVYHRFEPGSSLKGWSLKGSLGSGRNGISLSADSLLVSKTPFEGDFTAEYHVASISEGGQAGALFAYTDSENFGACYFSPDEQKVIIEITVEGTTTVTKVDTIRSFGEDTRFDCIQALQIERSGKDYTFYMNDRLLYTLRDSALKGGAIGYITKGAEASFGFIGGTRAVGGNGAADQFKTVSEEVGLIPAIHALESPSSVQLANGRVAASVGEGDTLSYRVLASADGNYDLSVLCHEIGADGMGMELYVDGKAAGTVHLSAVENGTATWIHRAVRLTKGQHVIALRAQGTAAVEKLCLLRAASQGAYPSQNLHTLSPQYSDGSWELAGGALIMSPGRSYGKRLYGSPNMGDYTVEVQVTPKASPNCGLLVRATNPGSPNFLGTQPTGEDASTATDWVQGYFIGLAADGVILGKQSYSYEGLAHADGQFQPGTTYTLKAVCEGANIRVYVDGKLYLDFTDPEPYMQGMIGVRTHNCAATFDHLTVTQNGVS